MLGFLFPTLPIQILTWAALVRCLTTGLPPMAAPTLPGGPADNVVLFPKRAPARAATDPGARGRDVPVIDLALARRRASVPSCRDAV